MKYKYIPVNNDLNKAVAFANSLDNDFVAKQQIKQKSSYINPLEIVKILQEDGWELKGVDEQRNSKRQITSHYLNLQHPDLRLKDVKGKNDSLASIYISNNCSGIKPMEVDLGVYRQVCSNGLMRRDTQIESKIHHIEMDYYTLKNKLSNITAASQKTIDAFKNLQRVDLTPSQMQALIQKAALLKYTPSELQNKNINELLTINRIEDEGNNLFTVFNRIQENLTGDVKNKNKDFKLNTQLFDLANQYAIAV